MRMSRVSCACLRFTAQWAVRGRATRLRHRSGGERGSPSCAAVRPHPWPSGRTGRGSRRPRACPWAALSSRFLSSCTGSDRAWGRWAAGELLRRAHVQHQDLAGAWPSSEWRCGRCLPVHRACLDERRQRHLQLDQSLLGLGAAASPRGRRRSCRPSGTGRTCRPCGSPRGGQPQRPRWALASFTLMSVSCARVSTLFSPWHSNSMSSSRFGLATALLMRLTCS